MLLQNKVIGKHFDGKKYIAKHYRKIKNRGYQQKFRKTHVERRRWVRIDTGLSETADGDKSVDRAVYESWVP